MRDEGLTHYWAIVLIISVPMHALAHRFRESKTFFAFLSSCLFIAGLCGAINLVQLLLTTDGQVKPGWAMPLVIMGAAVAFPATLICGIFVRLILMRWDQRAVRKAKR
jgi:hypothetical protein